MMEFISKQKEFGRQDDTSYIIQKTAAKASHLIGQTPKLD